MRPAADLAAIARAMRAAQDQVRQIAPFTSCHEDFDVAAAYVVADTIHRARVGEGAHPVGRKIGFTNPAMWSLYAVRDPIWAHVYDTTVVHLGAELHRCSLGRFAEPRIEPEIVLHFRAAPPVDGDATAVLACIDWVAHGFEIVQSHFPGWQFRAADTIADGSLHGTLLIGAHQPVAQLGADPVGALERFTLALSCQGELRETGAGSNVLGSPLLAIAHLVSVLDRSPGAMPIQAGELVTTGTITTAHPVRAGELWQTALQGIALPGLAVAFGA